MAASSRDEFDAKVRADESLTEAQRRTIFKALADGLPSPSLVSIVGALRWKYSGGAAAIEDGEPADSITSADLAPKGRRKRISARMPSQKTAALRVT